MRKQLDLTEGIFPMPVLMVATYNEDGRRKRNERRLGVPCRRVTP